MSSSGVLPEFQAGIDRAFGLADQMAAPIYDALGNVLGWVATEAAPYIGAGNAVAVTNAVGQTIGTVHQTITGATQELVQLGAATVAPAYDAAGNYVGELVTTVETGLSDALRLALKWGFIATFGVLLALELKDIWSED